MPNESGLAARRCIHKCVEEQPGWFRRPVYHVHVSHINNQVQRSRPEGLALLRFCARFRLCTPIRKPEPRVHLLHGPSKSIQPSERFRGDDAKRQTDLVFISLAQLISLSGATLRDAPSVPRTSAASASTTICEDCSSVVGGEDGRSVTDAGRERAFRLAERFQ